MKWMKYLFLSLMLLVLSACGQQSQSSQVQSGLRIVTSFYPIYSLVKEISGDYNDIRMIGSRNGIHSYEPSPADVKGIYDADVFIYHSKILESWAGRLEPNVQGSKVKVLEASSGLELQRVPGLEDVEVTEGMDEASLYDPHTWLDPVLVGQEAVLIGNLLAEADPERASYYNENASKLQQQYQDLADKYRPIFEKTRSKTFVTQHTAFSYMAKRYGLQQLGIAGVSEEEPNPRQLAEIKEFVDTYDVKTIFVEKGKSDKLAQTLKSSTGVDLKILDPLEADPENNLTYLENLDAVLDTLAKELQ